MYTKYRVCRLNIQTKNITNCGWSGIQEYQNAQYFYELIEGMNFDEVCYNYYIEFY